MHRTATQVSKSSWACCKMIKRACQKVSTLHAGAATDRGTEMVELGLRWPPCAMARAMPCANTAGSKHIIAILPRAEVFGQICEAMHKRWASPPIAELSLITHSQLTCETVSFQSILSLVHKLCHKSGHRHQSMQSHSHIVLPYPTGTAAAFQPNPGERMHDHAVSQSNQASPDVATQGQGLSILDFVLKMLRALALGGCGITIVVR